MEKPPEPRKLPAQRVDKGIEEYVEGVLEKNHLGEYFVARQAFPFGRPYGKLRISDISAADLSPLNLLFPQSPLPPPERLIYLDTETTGLAGGTGTCAFLIGIGTLEGTQFVVRQFFLRDYPEEKAILHALGEILGAFDGIVTYNGKTFDIPLLETRYALARQKSPFTRLLHLDALHPARRLWRLRLESCKLQDLESAVLGIDRVGDIPGSEIPAIYFDYLREGDARGLQPVFHHNALDIMTLAAITAELARAIGDGGAGTLDSPVDLFSLSRMFEVAGSREQSVETCQRALSGGLPEEIEARALHQLAAQYKRQRLHDLAVEKWRRNSREGRHPWLSMPWKNSRCTLNITSAIPKLHWNLRFLRSNACGNSPRLHPKLCGSLTASKGCNARTPAGKVRPNYRSRCRRSQRIKNHPGNRALVVWMGWQ